MINGSISDSGNDGQYRYAQALSELRLLEDRKSLLELQIENKRSEINRLAAAIGKPAPRQVQRVEVHAVGIELIKRDVIDDYADIDSPRVRISIAQAINGELSLELVD